MNWITDMVKEVNKVKKKMNKISTIYDDIEKEVFTNYDINGNRTSTPHPESDYKQPSFNYTLKDKTGNIIKQYN